MIKAIVKGTNYLIGGILNKRNIHITSSLEFLRRDRMIDKNYFDYIRLATLELVSNEIKKKKLAGSVAELGVYQGKFARYINLYFPDRTFYLFDTFRGFNEKDIKNELEENYSAGNQDFSNTSVDKVLKQMPFPEKCIPREGFFPETVNGIEEDFIFVSLDADLFEPIYAGLTFFYPRLAVGGYIFIHDFNNDFYRGARTAVEQFCDQQKINYTPIPDLGGSVIIAR